MADGHHNFSKGERASESHVVVSSRIRDNACRVVTYSSESAEFDGSDGAVMSLTVRADESFVGETSEIVISNIVLTTPEAEEYVASDSVCNVNSNSLGVGIISVDAQGEDAEYYTLQGIRVTEPTAGLYLCKKGNDVKKVVVK